MTSGIYFRENEKPKCPMCKGKGTIYVENKKVYPSGKVRDLGYFTVCKCFNKMVKLKK